MSDARALAQLSKLIVKHTTRTVKAIARDLPYPPAAAPAGFLRLYTRNRMTGGLIFIDEATNATVGAAMITDAGWG